MDYEKAYKEALERAKNMIDDLRKGEDILAVSELEAMFPELKESEDERIIKWIANYIHRGVFDEEEHPKALKAVEWLEKQKENPKSADSIPADCASDAKYEGGSPKHSDFPAGFYVTLPDGKKYYTKEIRCNGMNVKVVEPKQEWSEVELEFRGEKVKVKRPFFRDDNGRGYSTTEQDDEVTWNALRAWTESHGHTPFELYPKVEWSEEDEEVRRQLICVLSGGIALTTKETRSKMLEWLKSIRPQPHWKPTDEQLKALLNAEGYLREGDQFDSAKSIAQLYEQLKAIKEDKK